MMRGEQSTNRRTIGLVLLLCLTVLGQWCALDTQHQEHRSDEHCCLLCHVGPHATLDAIAPIFHAPALFSTWIAPVPETTAPAQAPALRSASRAPPAPSCS